MELNRWSDQHRDYWKSNFTTRSYYRKGTDFEVYEPAYRLGTEAHPGEPSRWEAIEDSIERRWEQLEDRSEATWDQVKDAAKDAWHYVEEKLPGDADGDGR